MECPICKKTSHIEVDTHSDGFAATIMECGDCQTLWTRKAGKAVILHAANTKKAVNA
jgi:hypothetical protein